MVFTTGFLFEERKRYTAILEEKVKEEIEKNRQQQLFLLQQSRFAQMGELIAMIAHQWRQPLNNLSLSNQLLILKYQNNKLNDTVVEDFKESSQKLIHFMSTTIDDFRNFFSPEVDKSTFILNDVIKNIFNMIEEIYHKEAITLHYHAQKEYTVSGYKNRLSQAILNLITNAKDALIENDTKDKQIWITLKEKEDKIILQVKDNGGGISEDIMMKIFDPYFSTKNKKNGTGLGLYMAKIIIEEHMQAKIEVQNYSQGAIFSIVFQKNDNT